MQFGLSSDWVLTHNAHATLKYLTFLKRCSFLWLTWILGGGMPGTFFCQTLALRKLLWTRPFYGKVCVDLRGWYYINSRTHNDLFHKSGLRKNKSTLELIHCNLEISVMFRHFLVNKTLPGNPVPRIQLFLGNLFDGKASRQRRQLRTGAPADRKKNLGWKTRPQCGCYNTCTHPPALEATFGYCKPSEILQRGQNENVTTNLTQK